MIVSPRVCDYYVISNLYDNSKPQHEKVKKIFHFHFLRRRPRQRDSAVFSISPINKGGKRAEKKP